MQVVHSERHRGHAPSVETYLGVPIPSNEVPARADAILTALRAAGGFEVREPTEHGLDPIHAVHDPGLVTFLEEAWTAAVAQGIERDFLVADTYPTRGLFQGMSDAFVGARPEPTAAGGRAGWWGLDSSNPIVEGTYDAARAAVDVALTTADLVLGGETVAYGLCRPPGHHAAESMAGGYCFFNNAAIAAQAIVAATGERVAILDVDVHHGNGTQQIFWRREDVRYVSLHSDPRRLYPFYLGHADEIGEGPGRGANRNLPQPLRADDATYLGDLDRALDWIDSSPGTVIVVSLGFDTYEKDPIGDLALTSAGYLEMGRRVGALGRRLVILQEGGYHVGDLGANAVAWLRGASGQAPPPA
ncbi:MAG TPA: histone deacetylase family protein [Candidatus Limnocylindrales bacterium]|nr:histone deacetylase family protein [Candidatus Limnocylindrales bacterium]